MLRITKAFEYYCNPYEVGRIVDPEIDKEGKPFRTVGHGHRMYFDLENYEVLSAEEEATHREVSEYAKGYNKGFEDGFKDAKNWAVKKAFALAASLEDL